MYVAEGLFDLGITGRDWVEETASDVVIARRAPVLQGHRPARSRSCVAVPQDSPSRRSRTCPQGVRVSTEYPELTRRFFEEQGIDADIRLSYGATEAKVPDIVDCIVEITETGRALRAAGLKVIDTILSQLHRAHRQPGGLRRPREAPRHGPDPAPCSRACSRPGARCW